jgi:8-oxo-dGTP pyrophosphatase MutT (NUDIX family)
MKQERTEETENGGPFSGTFVSSCFGISDSRFPNSIGHAMKNIRQESDPEGNPWTRLSRRMVYENPWIRLDEDQVIRPDGKPGIYGVVHFKNRAVGVVPLDENDRILLVGQYRYTLDEYSWEIPEGGVPLNEDPLSGAKRELLEETGYTAGKWRELGRAHLSNSVSDELAIYYLAQDLRPGTPRPEGTERLAVRWVSFQEALGMVENGTLTDALSIIAIQKVALARGK